MGTQPEYQTMIDTMFSNTEDMMEAASEPELIAEVVYEAATDGKKQLRYVAGEDAKALYAQRLEIGAEAQRTAW
jgi:hypothetical protein